MQKENLIIEELTEAEAYSRLNERHKRLLEDPKSVGRCARFMKEIVCF